MKEVSEVETTKMNGLFDHRGMSRSIYSEREKESLNITKKLAIVNSVSPPWPYQYW